MGGKARRACRREFVAVQHVTIGNGPRLCSDARSQVEPTPPSAKSTLITAPVLEISTKHEATLQSGHVGKQDQNICKLETRIQKNADNISDKEY